MRIIALVAVVAVLLAGCTLKDVEVSQHDYINTDDTWSVSTHNNYLCTDATTVKNDDGSYTVTFTFEQINPKQEARP